MTSPSGGPAPLDCAVTVLLPGDVVRSAAGHPAALVVRTTSGWRVVAAPGAPDQSVAAGAPLVEALTLADLVAAELGGRPEPDRQARRAARTAGPGDDAVDARDAELAELRHTVAQLEHALAARVSIERAIGVLAERQQTSPREAFEQLRRRARSAGRPAADLAHEVLDGLAGSSGAVVPDPRHAGTAHPDTAHGARS